MGAKEKAPVKHALIVRQLQEIFHTVSQEEPKWQTTRGSQE